MRTFAQLDCGLTIQGTYSSNGVFTSSFASGDGTTRLNDCSAISIIVRAKSAWQQTEGTAVASVAVVSHRDWMKTMQPIVESTPKSSLPTVTIDAEVWKAVRFLIEGMAFMETVKHDHPDLHRNVIKLARCVENAEVSK